MIMKDFQIIFMRHFMKKLKAKTILTDYGFPRYVWDNVPDERRVTSNHVGKRVHVAKYSPTMYTVLSAYYEPGEKGFPEGGVRVWNEKFEQGECYTFDSVIIHDSELKKIKVNGNKKSLNERLHDKMKRKTKKKQKRI